MFTLAASTQRSPKVLLTSTRLLWSLLLAGASFGGTSLTGLAPAMAQPLHSRSVSAGFTPSADSPAGPVSLPAMPSRQEITLQTGDVQVTLYWDSADDLDLSVKGPSGESVSFFNPEITSGGQLDADANSSCRGQTVAQQQNPNQDQGPIENIFWPAGSGVPGDYMVTVKLFNDCGSGTPADFTLRVSTYQEVQTYSGTVSYEQDSAHFPFSLPAAPATSAP